MPNRPQPLPFLAQLTAYQSSANKVETGMGKIRLCYNEGALGPSPKAIEAARQAAFRMNHYPDMGYARLRQALAENYNIDAARIVCGAGSDDLIGLLVHSFLREGDEAICSQYGFAMYPVAIKSVGAKPVMVPEKDLRADLPAMLAAVTPRTKIVFLANPNNPTGSWVTRGEINAFLRELPPHVLFVYDAAYADYMDDADYSDGFEWAPEDGRVCVLRTFSKIHGLGGMRVGFCYGSSVVTEALNKVRNPFNVSLAGEAAAIASLKDDAFIEKCRAHTLQWREKLFDKLMEMGLKPYPSKGNFVLAGLHSPDHAKDLFSFLEQKNILIRPMAGYGLPDCVRISIGMDEEMQALFQALDHFKDSPHGKSNGKTPDSGQARRALQ
ncbi:MAG TPA: histidinol-phosphate transaminase [Alphaproteobacteria bacterium]|nr:histidinol-phosphate transaminase [Alphaproteobacteria bacterium]